VRIVLIIVEFVVSADDLFDCLGIGGSSATEDRVGPVTFDLGKEFLTLAEDPRISTRSDTLREIYSASSVLI